MPKALDDNAAKKTAKYLGLTQKLLLSVSLKNERMQNFSLTNPNLPIRLGTTWNVRSITFY